MRSVNLQRIGTQMNLSNRNLFEITGNTTDQINVEISNRIIQLFSEGLYSSPNKAVEELVSNSFDAGAKNVHVILSPDLRDPDATIVVIDDGEGMDADELKEHWIIGKRVKVQDAGEWVLPGESRSVNSALASCPLMYWLRNSPISVSLMTLTMQPQWTIQI